MEVILPQQLAELVKQKLDAGLYGSPEEVIAEALKLLDQRDKMVSALRRDIQDGLTSGPGKPFDEVAVKGIKKRGRELLDRHKNAG